MAPSSRDSEPALEPGPPDFSEIEGNPHRHDPDAKAPGASTVPGAGPNPTAADDDDAGDDADRTTPASSSVPGAGPNPDPGT